VSGPAIQEPSFARDQIKESTVTKPDYPEPARDAAGDADAACFGGCTDPDCMGECMDPVPG
jgi:hypothetical protein